MAEETAVATQEQPKPAETTPAPPATEATPEPKKEATFFKRWDGDTVEALPSDLPDDSKPAGEEKPAQTEEKKEEKPPEPKTYASGRFKSDADLEEGYKNLEAKFTQTAQEAAEAKRKLAELESGKTTQAAATQTAEVATQAATQKPDIVEMIVNRPEEFVKLVSQQAAQQTQVQLDTLKRTQEWENKNKDLVGREHLVAAEMRQILQSDPEKAKAFAEGRGNPDDLLNEATGRVRNWIGEITTAAKKEALTTKETIASLGVSSVSQAQPNPTVTGAAPPTIDPVDEALAVARRERARTTGLTLPRR